MPDTRDTDALRAFIFSGLPLERQMLSGLARDAGLEVVQCGAAADFAARPRVLRSDARALVFVPVSRDELHPGYAGFLSEFLPRGRLVFLARDELARADWAHLPSGLAGVIPLSLPVDALTAALALIARGLTILPAGFHADEGELVSLRVEAGADQAARLTDRQREICRQVVRGRSNKQIARALGISVNTVNAHLHAIRQRLGVSNRTMIAMRLQGTDAPLAIARSTAATDKRIPPPEAVRRRMLHLARADPTWLSPAPPGEPTH